eukprot:scaffold9178_cov176-Amphora_coffeaeformis.AAC.1
MVACTLSFLLYGTHAFHAPQSRTRCPDELRLHVATSTPPGDWWFNTTEDAAPTKPAKAIQTKKDPPHPPFSPPPVHLLAERNNEQREKEELVEEPISQDMAKLFQGCEIEESESTFFVLKSLGDESVLTYQDEAFLSTEDSDPKTTTPSLMGGSSGGKPPPENENDKDDEKKQKVDAVSSLHFISIPGEEEEETVEEQIVFSGAVSSFGANVVNDALRAFGDTVEALAARPEVQAKKIKGVPSTTVLTAGALAAAGVAVATHGDAGVSMVWMAALVSAYATWTESVVGDITRALGTWSYEITANILIPTLNEWNDYRQVNRRAQILVAKNTIEKRDVFSEQWNRFQTSVQTWANNLIWGTSKTGREVIPSTQIADGDRKETQIASAKSEGFTARLDEWTLEQIEKTTPFETPAIIVDSVKGVRQSVVEPLSQLQYGVRSETCVGAGIVGALVALSQGADVNEVALASILALYVSISQGLAGDAVRFVGTATFDILSLGTILAKYTYGPERFPKFNIGNFGAFEIVREHSSRVSGKVQKGETSEKCRASVPIVGDESTSWQTDALGLSFVALSSAKNLDNKLLATKEASDTETMRLVESKAAKESELIEMRNTGPARKQESDLPIGLPSKSKNTPEAKDKVAEPKSEAPAVVLQMKPSEAQPGLSSPEKKESIPSIELPRKWAMVKAWADGDIPQNSSEDFDQGPVNSDLPRMWARTKAWAEKDGISFEKLASAYPSMATMTNPVKDVVVADPPVVLASPPPTRPLLKPIPEGAVTGDPVKAELVARKLLARRLEEKLQPAIEPAVVLFPPPPTRPPLKPAREAAVTGDPVKAELIARKLLARRLEEKPQPAVEPT